MKRVPLICALIAVVWTLLQPLRPLAGETPGMNGEPGGNVEITVVVDNHAAREALETTWGFSCVIRGFEKTILFDTGKDGAVLMRNLRRLNIASSDIDVVVLSHAHRDHTGGLEAFLAANPRVDVYLLSSSPRPLFEVVRKHGANPVPVKGRAEICRNVSTTGALGTDIEEHALVLRTRTGLVVITGCAHPGIVRILQRVKEDFPSSDILLAMGGFHLLRSRGLVGIIDEMRALGVRYVAPCHCSGRAAKRLFRQRFKERSIALWAGARIRISGGEEPCAEPTCMTIF